MKLSPIFLNFKSINTCDCACHREGLVVMHCFPCCNLTGVQFLKTNGDADLEAMERILDLHPH